MIFHELSFNIYLYWMSSGSYLACGKIYNNFKNHCNRSLYWKENKHTLTSKHRTACFPCVYRQTLGSSYIKCVIFNLYIACYTYTIHVFKTRSVTWKIRFKSLSSLQTVYEHAPYMPGIKCCSNKQYMYKTT